VTSRAQLAAFAIVFALALGLGACAGAERNAATPADSPGESLVRVMEALAGQIETSGTSCGNFAVLVRDWVERERPSIARLTAEIEQAVGTMTDAEIERLDERLTTALEVIVHQATACADHDGAQRAFAEFDAVIEGS
jgi:hypothetical protein